MTLRSRFRIRTLSRKLIRTTRMMGPTFVTLAVAGATSVAHAQGTMDFTGAQTLMEHSKRSQCTPARSYVSAGLSSPAFG